MKYDFKAQISLFASEIISHVWGDIKGKFSKKNQNSSSQKP